MDSFSEHPGAFDGPLEPGCKCETCRHHSLAYLAHLFRVYEPMGPFLLATHNLHHMARLMASVRQEIHEGRI